jgi:GH24 family phage-related lysozyme (muramidase)
LSWIEVGSEGDYVRAWQRIVGAGADGKFGPGTRAKVVLWQLARGVDPDGVVGALTRAALRPGDLIHPYEGLRLRTYDDHDGKPLVLGPGRVWRRPDGAECLGYPTIGWGRRLYPGENIATCTREEADQWFEEDLARTRLPAVRRANLAEAGQVTAAASFAYNCGTGALAKLAKAGFAEDVWLDYKRTKGVENVGLLARRKEEFALFQGISHRADDAA